MSISQTIRLWLKCPAKARRACHVEPGQSLNFASESTNFDLLPLRNRSSICNNGLLISNLTPESNLISLKQDLMIVFLVTMAALYRQTDCFFPPFTRPGQDTFFDAKNRYQRMF